MEKNKIQSFQQKPAIEKLIAGFLFSNKKEDKEMNEKDEKELEEKGWVKVECPHKTEKCGKYHCPPRKREEFKHFTKQEFREARNMANCPFVNYTI